MKYKAGIILGAVLAGAGLYAFAPAASAHDDTCKADGLVGTWLTEKKDAKVEIYKSGAGYDGKLVWLKDPNNPDGKPKLDVHNPDKAKRSDPILGLVNVKHLKYDDGCKWHDGSIYDPKVGKTYDASAELESGGSNLDLRGYIGISLFGRTTTWHRVK
jgi:uncharacterized protein (DUF2147 family)